MTLVLFSEFEDHSVHVASYPGSLWTAHKEPGYEAKRSRLRKCLGILVSVLQDLEDTKTLSAKTMLSIVNLCKNSVIQKPQLTKKPSLPRESTESSLHKFTVFLNTEIELEGSDGTLCDGPVCEPKNFAKGFWQLHDDTFKSFDGDGVVIAILDSGIQASHFAFKHKILEEYSRNFCSGKPDDNNVDDKYGHGTGCAGVAAGRPFWSADLQYLGGVAPEAKLIICKVCEKKSPKVKAVEDALQYICDLDENIHVHIVSLSVGFRDILPGLQDKIDVLAKKRTICIASAGNDALKYSPSVSCPASCQNTIAVGSHDQDGRPSQFTAEGDEVLCLTLGDKVCAPALDTSDQQDNMALACYNGTSVAAPAVAGLVALIIQFMNRVGRKKKVNFNTIERVLKKMTNNRILRPRDFFASVVKNPNAANYFDMFIKS